MRGVGKDLTVAVTVLGLFMMDVYYKLNCVIHVTLYAQVHPQVAHNLLIGTS
jgi:hypothetical protein